MNLRRSNHHRHPQMMGMIDKDMVVGMNQFLERVADHFLVIEQ
jgi:hypothetical protein